LADGWGWGEHLSDIYGNICLDELSLLLLLAKKLPARVHDKIEKLFHTILALDDYFAGGPRVPAIRLYAFRNVPMSFCYRDHIRKLPDDVTLDQDQEVHGLRQPNCCAPYRTASGGTWHPLGQTLVELGWHELANKCVNATVKPEREIPCVGGSAAHAVLDGDWRMGSLTRFPLMDIAEHQTWGLAWQTFPVSLWQRGKMWAFLQWEVDEEGKRRCHPATAKFDDGIRAITQAVNPPIVGRTYAIQQEGNLLALRVMPGIAAGWRELIDRFRIVGGQTKIVYEGGEGDWLQLVLNCGGREIGVQCLRLSDGAGPRRIQTEENILDWSVDYGAKELTGKRGCANLWGISLSGRVNEAPLVQRDPKATLLPRMKSAWLIEWKWPSLTWKVRVDLVDRDPLKMR